VEKEEKTGVSSLETDNMCIRREKDLRQKPFRTEV